MNQRSKQDAAVWTVSWLVGSQGRGRGSVAELTVVGTQAACAIAMQKVDELQKLLGFTDANESVQLKRGI